MKKEWATKSIGEACEVIAGQSPAGSAYNSDSKGLPFYQGKKEFDEKYIGPPTTWTTEVTKRAKANDILMSVRAPVGPINFATQEICIGRGLAAIRAKQGLDQNFLFYFLLSIQSQIGGRDGAVFPSISRGEICSISLPLPPLSEQQRIVAILDEAFARLATAAANAEKNLNNARELFESYLALVFTGKGNGWVRRQIGDVATTQYGLSGTLNSDGDGYKIFRMGEVQDGRLVDTGRMKFINIKRQEFEEYRLRRGDVLFNRTNSSDLVGKTGFFDLEGEYCFASYLVRVNFDPVKMNSKFAAYLMNTKDFLARIRAKAARSVNQANINATILRNEAIDFPSSVQVQADLAAKFDALSLETQRLKQSYEVKLGQLAKLKQSILQKAFSGELTSPPSQAIKEAAE